jgi:hypothetical protein
MSDEPRGTRGLTYLWLIASVVGIVAGGIVWLAGSHDAADAVWAVTTAVGLVPLAWTTVVGLIEREAGVDLIALLAMAGSLALGEYLAGAVIAVMLANLVSLWLRSRATGRMWGFACAAAGAFSPWTPASWSSQDHRVNCFRLLPKRPRSWRSGCK